ncbi:PREDICTED: uncharacterized protein LOC109173449 [Ipomoea nil]|uniref:uncharacterized protein LOC109173449 n=1 Tax=Ipomoea nil TaxID=35883 RepID=UPI00090149AB|nr:PREDICTED: uncharacterized protein LOC109173449 [Ipomoea nil]
MAKPSCLRPLFSMFLSLLGLLLLHLGCFIFSSSSSSAVADNDRPDQPPQNSGRNRKVSSSSSSSRLKRSTAGAVSASWSFVKRLFSCAARPAAAATPPPPHPSIPSPCSSSRSLTKPIVIPLASPDKLSPDPLSDICSDQPNIPLRNNIYPCTLCGEIFLATNLLEQHQFIKHAISELVDGDSGNNIVQIIFKTGWPETAKNPVIRRILKIHNSPKILTRFEEYREHVKSKAARNIAGRRRDERCIADGNELLRFHCATFLCGLGENGASGVCTNQYCSVCGIIKTGFSPKMDGISTQSSGWRAHAAVPEEIEEEFKFMHVKRAMLVCRVIAGRVGSDPDVVDKDDPGFDSLVGRENGAHPRLDEEEELWVFNPRAVLPCFVIVYNV